MDPVRDRVRVGTIVWDGYRWKSFTISELSAIDAPSRPLVPSPMLVFGVLSICFAFGVLAVAGRKRDLRLTGWLLLAIGILSLAGPFVLVVSGMLAAVEGPRIAGSDPPPWVGLTERICVGAYLLWMAVLSGALLRTPSARADLRTEAATSDEQPAEEGLAQGA
jgi:hypothetical protein